MRKLYYIFLILFRIPSYIIHEILHFIPAFLFRRRPKISMNIDFKKGTSKPCVNYIFSGYKYKEFIICCSPVLGLLIPLILSLFTLNLYIVMFTIYQFINFKCSFISKIDFRIIKESFAKIKASRYEFDLK